MTERDHSYTWADYSARIELEAGLDKSFEIQQWCIDNLGNRWATTPPLGYHSV